MSKKRRGSASRSPRRKRENAVYVDGEVVSLVEDAKKPFPITSLMSSVECNIKQCCDIMMNAFKFDSEGKEVEIRWGVVIDNKFQSGIQKEHFYELATRLEAAQDMQQNRRVSVDYFYEDSSSTQYIRFECEHDKIVRVVRKVRQQVSTIKFPGMYDTRVAFSTEEQLKGICCFPEHTWILKREKRRIEYTLPDSLWAFHLTIVKEFTRDSNTPSVRHEVEIELAGDNIRLMSNHVFASQQIIKLKCFIEEYNVFSSPRILSSVTAVQKQSSQPGFHASLSLLKVEQKLRLLKFRQDVYQAMGLPLTKTSTFPGSMPTALMRSNLGLLQDSALTYQTSWKADGERFLMYISYDKSVILFDRRFDGFDLGEVDPFFAGKLAETFATREYTIFDGEIVYNVQDKTYDYLIFDFICDNGISMCHFLLQERHRRAGERLRLIESHVTLEEYKQFPIRFLSKGLFTQSSLTEMFQNIKKTRNGDFLYEEKYLCDGAIFSPNKPYICFTSAETLKVKLTDKQLTVDFLLKRLDDENNMWAFYCADTSGGFLECKRQKITGSQQTLCQTLMRELEMERRGNPMGMNTLIVECYYDRTEGKWCILKRRTDKAKPNVFLVYCDNMEALAQGILLEQLVRM